MLDKFTRLVDIPYSFQTFEERSILAFCKTSDGVQAAKEAGASFVGGTELIKQIQVRLNKYLITFDIIKYVYA